MSFQSPLISIPKKSTIDVDWTNPIRQTIARSYGEDPNSYSEECSVLQRCRQDAVRGAGSDQTARDLLYKYFGQLELLELRFAEIKVTFLWNDAFTLKATTQSSLAFEKASIIHLLSSVLSTLASTGSRADPEGVKRAYFNSRAAAGMLTYINENFLHAPSTDLSREVVHFLIGIMMAQATEIFTEKLVEEKKAPGLAARSANQAAGMYNALVEEMKEFQGKGIFDRNWLYVLQIKAKLFSSFAQYYRSTADGAAGKHGAALVRMRIADTLAQEASRQASSFTYTFSSTATPSLPSDAAASLAEISKAHAALCVEAKDQAIKDNDLIYHDILPSEASLPNIDKLPPAAPITIQEVYQNAEVSKLIGPDIFVRLVPLAVHESASVYSEEKAKLVRGEVERTELSEVEVRAGLEHLGYPQIANTWRKMADDDFGDSEVEVPSTIWRLKSEVERGGSIEPQLRNLEGERERCRRELQELHDTLENESRECERMRYAPQFTQSPSGQQTAHFRSNISTNLAALSSASQSDGNLSQLWQSIQSEISLVSSNEGNLQRIAREIAGGKQPEAPSNAQSLLDLQEDEGSKSGISTSEKEMLNKAAADAQEKLDRLRKVRQERDDVLKDLKEKIQNDDVSSLLLLNRRSQNVEPQLFASELEKFKPYQGRISAAIQASNALVSELEGIVRQVEKEKGVRDRQRVQKDSSRRLRDWERSLEATGESYREVRDGLARGLGYYESLQGVIQDLRREVKGFVSSRESERNRMVSEIETRQRISSSPPPPRPSAHTSTGLDGALAGLSLGGSTSPYPASPPPKPAMGYPSPAPPSQPSSSFYPPPPAAPSSHSSNPYDFSSLGSMPSAFSATSSPTSSRAPSMPPRPDPAPQPRQASYGYSSPPPSNPYPPPPQPSRPSQSYAPPAPSYPSPPPSQQQHQQNYAPPPPSQSYAAPSQSYSSASAYPAPPPPQPTRSTSGQYYPAPPAQQSYQYSSPPPHQNQGQQQQYAPYQPAPQQSGYPQQQQQQQQPPPQQYGGYASPPPSHYPAPPPQGQQQGYGYQQQGGYQYR